MRYKFHDKKILIIHENDFFRAMLIGIFNTLIVKEVDETSDISQAILKTDKNKYDIILSDLSNGNRDAIDLANSIRKNSDSACCDTPIIALCSHRDFSNLEDARKAGISDIIQAPYSADIIAEKLNYVVGLNKNELKENTKPPTEPIKSNAQSSNGESEQESLSLTHMLLDYYLKHNEIVLMKLKFAQEATQKCISEVRSTYQKLQDKDNTNIAEFKDFDQMWEEVIKLFVANDLSEDEMHQIERLVTRVPKEIKKHYDDLSQQDKSFMTLLESINHNAYMRAKEKVMITQEQPSPFNGKTIQDYKPRNAQGDLIKRNIADDVFMISPKKKQG